MKSIDPSMRLKVKRDTFFVSYPGSGVYFRNNMSSFHMKGKSIDQWVEKLLPMFNGKYSLENLTDGLPVEYKKRVFDIAEVLYRNGFVQDVSSDLPHQLSEFIVEKYASQIEFLQNITDSGAYRFEVYRQAKVLAIGSGRIFLSLISSLLQSGLPKFHIFITDTVPTNRKRITEMLHFAKKTDQEIEIKEIPKFDDYVKQWHKLIQPYDFILYVSQHGDIEEVRAIHQTCRKEGKTFLPALYLENVGIAGPLTEAESEGCFESAWRSLHQSVFDNAPRNHDYSSPAGAMLTNVIVFELFKKRTGVSERGMQSKIYLLDLETLEGNWYAFTPHPLVNNRLRAQWVDDFPFRFSQKTDNEKSGGLLMYLSQLTSAQTGIFHILDEGDLNQLPLAQCRVQVIDPLSEGPAQLLEEIICNGLTHQNVRKEAGLTGIETYVLKMNPFIIEALPPRRNNDENRKVYQEFIGYGAGENFAEAVCRGLEKCLTEELNQRLAARSQVIFPVKIDSVDDRSCNYYLRVITTLYGEPVIGLGKDIFGFPVVWVKSKDRWYGGAGLNETLALKKALQHVLLKDTPPLNGSSLEHSSVSLQNTAKKTLTIYRSEETEQKDLLQSALSVLKENGKCMLVFEVDIEPTLKKEWLHVYGVILREEESM